MYVTILLIRCCATESISLPYDALVCLIITFCTSVFFSVVPCAKQKLRQRTLLRGEIGSEVEHHRRHSLKVILRLPEELAIQVIGFRTQRQPRVQSVVQADSCCDR
jgi:hypothetical protein